MKEEEKKIYNLELSEKDIKLILATLNECSYKLVNGTINKIFTQIEEQNKINKPSE